MQLSITPLYNTQIENVTLPDGTKRFHLRCTGVVKPTWKKDDEIISFPVNRKFDLTRMSSDEYPLLCVEKTNKFEGSYTCHANKSSPPLKRINVQVLGRSGNAFYVSSLAHFPLLESLAWLKSSCLTTTRFPQLNFDLAFLHACKLLCNGKTTYGYMGPAVIFLR